MSKATSLSSRVRAGSAEVIEDIEESIRSASEGPPKSVLRASGFRLRFEGGGAFGSAVEAAEFSTLHLRSSFIPGSIVVLMCGVDGGVVW